MAVISEDVKLIEYRKSVDTWNCLSHAAGAVLALVGLAAAVIKASGGRAFISAIIYGLSMTAVYVVSAVYHGLAPGEKKRKARLIDHSTIPLLIAGTATPCALVTLYNQSVPHCILVVFLSWFCVIFGVAGKLFFFEKSKTAVMAVYIISGAVMLLSVIPLLGEGSSINTHAYFLLIAGSLIYIIGGLFCRAGIKHEEMHIVFHFFVMLGSAVHYYVIYQYIL